MVQNEFVEIREGGAEGAGRSGGGVLSVLSFFARFGVLVM